MLVFVVSFYAQNNFQYHPAFMPGALLDKNSSILIFIFFILFMIKNILAYLIFSAQFKFVYNVASRMSSDNLSEFIEGDFKNYTSISSAAKVRHISDYPIQLSHFILFGTLQLITEIILVCLSITGIILFNAKLFLILFIVLIPPVILISFITRRKLKDARAHVKEASELSLQYLQESLHGYVEANIYNKKSFFISRFSFQQKKFNKYLSDVHVLQGLPARMVEIFAVFGLFILIYISRSASVGVNQVINIGAFIVVAYKLIPGIVKISNIGAQIKTYEFTLNNMENHQGHAEQKKQSGKKIKSISFKDVSFNYNEHSQLHSLNFDIHSGQFIGISGDSGKGKTTLINLLLGFLDPIKGNILINDSTTNTTEIQQYWGDIAYVKQQTFLISDTILKNITFDEKDYDDEMLKRALFISGLDDFLNKSQKGLKEIITDNGKNISGGQRQRIAIARAIYKDAGLIILDEPFNELDSISEQILIAHMKDYCKQGKIVALITHNAQSLSYCDKVIPI